MIFTRRAAPALLTMVALCGRAAATDAGAITLQQALDLARDRAPAVLAGRARIEEARGRLTGASVRLGGNPVLDVGAGRRRTDAEDYTNVEGGFMQGLGVPGRRSARIDGAEADVMRWIATSEDIARRHLQEVAETFLLVLHAEERLRLMSGAVEIAQGIADAAERRFQAGDVAVLDVHLAGSVLARVRSEAASAEAERVAWLGRLRGLLGMAGEEPLAVRGDLGRMPAYDLAGLVDKVGQRPDVRALAAEIDQADADARLGEVLGRPEFGAGLRYEDEGEEQVILGLVSVSLPALDRGQGPTAEARARASRLRLEHEGLRRASEAEMRTAFDVYEKRREAEAPLRAVLPSLAELEELAAASYEAGQISLIDLLLLRREALEARVSHSDSLLEAALAAVRLEASAGVLP